MTGFGAATTRRDGYIITSEIKTVNNRYLKTSYRISDGFSSLETRLDAFLRNHIERGTVNISLRIRPETGRAGYKITDAAVDYIDAALLVRDTFAERGLEIPLGTVADFLRLPGAMTDANDDGADSNEALWPAVEENLLAALNALNVMRDAEGTAMEKNLRSLCGLLAEKIGEIEKLAPTVAENYRVKLTERIGKILAEQSMELDPACLVREIALFTDKADISEETVRFRSHLDQFDRAMARGDSCGKRLDFLTQEMFREVNTTGSKGSESAITNVVIDMKTTIEKIREMVQNVE